MYEYKKRIGFSEIDEGSRLKLTSLINLMQDTCTFQSEDRGYPLKQLMEDNIGWFLLTWHIKIRELPMFGEEVVTKTWANKCAGIMAGRNFTMERDGDILVRADSNWVLMDKEKLRPIRIPEGMKEAYELSDPLPGEWMGRKLKVPEDAETVYDFTVSFMHLDTNRHMNNAFYIDAALAALWEGRSRTDIKEIRVEYRNQAVLNDHILVKKRDNAVVLVEEESGRVLSIIEADC